VRKPPPASNKAVSSLIQGINDDSARRLAGSSSRLIGKRPRLTHTVTGGDAAEVGLAADHRTDSLDILLVSNAIITIWL
jgi:hypothetical protein